MKSLIREAFLTEEGLSEGYAVIEGTCRIAPERDPITRLLGYGVAYPSSEMISKLFTPTNENGFLCRLEKVPRPVTSITILDKVSTHVQYQRINRLSLRNVKLGGFYFSGDFGCLLSDFKIWLRFRVKSRLQCNNNLFHSIHVWLAYNYGCEEKHMPPFGIKLVLPEYFIEESKSNPNFINEVSAQLGF